MFPQKIYPESYAELLSAYNVKAPENYNFAYDFFDKIAAEDPSRLAFVHVDPEGVRSEYDYAQISRASNELAAGLMQQGLGPGDRVMLILYRRIEFWIAMLALHKIGAAPVPSPSLLTAHDIVYRVKFAKIKAAICDESLAERVHKAQKDCPTLKVLVRCGQGELLPGWHGFRRLSAQGAAAGFTPPSPRPGGDDPLLIFFTSGTTGHPKMVEHLHHYPLGHFLTGAQWHNLEPGDLHLTLADTGWGKAVWGKFYGQLMAGAAVFVWDFRGKFEPAKLLEILVEHKVTTFCAPPTVFRFLVREDLKSYDLSHLRHCTTAGELLNDSVFHAWKAATGLPIYEGYGQTETTLQIGTFPCMEPRPGSIGKPCPMLKVALLDANGHFCQPGEEGEICIDCREGKPLGLFHGYLDEPEKTEKAFKHGYYHTGDKAWADEDGYLWFLGRVDDLIKSSGYRIGPFEVESALITHPAVIEAAVTGVPDPVRGQAVKATVVLGTGYAASEELKKELQEHVKKVTAPYKYPRIIEFSEELPKTISGKIMRAEIRRRDAKAQK